MSRPEPRAGHRPWDYLSALSSGLFSCVCEGKNMRGVDGLALGQGKGWDRHLLARGQGWGVELLGPKLANHEP